MNEQRHLHRCQNCGVIWGHGNMMVGDLEAHKCPKCGAKEWRTYSGGKPALAKTAQPAQTIYVIDLLALLKVATLILAGVLVGELIVDWLAHRA